jgi:hypothetical protein
MNPDEELAAHDDPAIHNCIEADCQIDPFGKRIRNPQPGEPDADPTVPLLPT